jgi:hypothetical protein
MAIVLAGTFAWNPDFAIPARPPGPPPCLRGLASAALTIFASLLALFAIYASLLVLLKRFR